MYSRDVELGEDAGLVCPPDSNGGGGGGVAVTEDTGCRGDEADLHSRPVRHGVDVKATRPRPGQCQ